MKTKTKVSTLAATIILIGSLAGGANGAVVWIVSDDGTDLTLKATGTLMIGSVTGSLSTLGGIVDISHDSRVLRYHGGANYYTGSGIGQESGNDPWIAGGVFRSSENRDSGTTFGHTTTSLNWDNSLGASPGAITPDATMVILNMTVTDAFGTNLDSGAVLLWTDNSTGDTISISKVPEPSSVLLLGLGSMGILLNRKKV